jgi:hypothetical protein
MNKTEVYSWRLDPDLKQRLEHAARAEKTSIGGLLDRIARDWLGRQRSDEDDEAMQRRLRVEAARWIGSIQGNDPTRAERAKEIVRKRIRAKHRATQRAD